MVTTEKTDTEREAEYQARIAIIAYKPENELTPEDIKLRMIEKGRCRQSFLYWLRYARIIQVPTLEEPGGVIKFEMWDHLRETIANLLTQKQIVIMKSRQIGASWLLSAYDLWSAMSKPGSQVMIFSKGKIEAIEKLAKCHRIYEHLPEFLKLKMDPSSATEMGFPVMSSFIKAFAATETAGISFTASILDVDEWSEHPYAIENYIASKPVRDAGGQFIGVFSILNEENLNGLAVNVFCDAIAGKNGFKPLFFSWTVRPGRDKKWYEETERSIPQMDLKGLTPELYMQRNYPASIAEALRMPQLLSAFDIATLDEMVGETRNPIKVTRDGVDSNIVHIYQDFHIGEFFIAGTDVGHGVGQDYSVTAIMNVRTGCVVADIMSNVISPEELAYHSVKLLDIFKNPLWFPEDNEWGRTVINQALNLGYNRMGYRDKHKTKIGHHTDEKSRFELFGLLIPAMNNHQITIYSLPGLKQFYDVIRNSKKGGKIEAVSPKNDDYPVATGICLLYKDQVSIISVNPKPVASLHFTKSYPAGLHYA